MGTALRLNKKQILFLLFVLLFVLLFLLVTTVIVMHAATPNVFHMLALRPDVFNRR
jgi:hypothetical protein